MDRFSKMKGLLVIGASFAVLGLLFEMLFFLPVPAGTVWEIPLGHSAGRAIVFLIVSVPVLGLIGFALKHFFGRATIFSLLFDYWERKRSG